MPACEHLYNFYISLLICSVYIGWTIYIMYICTSLLSMHVQYVCILYSCILYYTIIIHYIYTILYILYYAILYSYYNLYYIIILDGHA